MRSGGKLHEFLTSILDKVGGMLYVPANLPQEQRHWYSLHRLVGALGQGWLIGGKKYLLSPPKIETQFLSRPARNQVSAPCELIRLLSLSIRDHVAQPYKTA